MDILSEKSCVFLVHLASVDDPEVEFVTFCKGENELAMFLLHYNKDLYVFLGAEDFAPGNRVFWDYKELLNIPKKGEK